LIAESFRVKAVMIAERELLFREMKEYQHRMYFP